MSKWLKYFLILVGLGIVLLVIIQLIPLNYNNPAEVTQVQWASPQTKALFDRACADCHSNRTTWPWYAKVAPIKLLVYRDVTDGREHFNISNLQAMDARRLDRLPREIERTVSEGEMPMGIYVAIHPTASLTDQERQQLIDGLQKTLSNTTAGK